METVEAKELLLTLMQEVKDLKTEQVRHHTFVEAKLPSIEAQVLKTNGRVTKNELEIGELKKDSQQIKTIFYTLSAVLSVVWAGVTFFFDK